MKLVEVISEIGKAIDPSEATEALEGKLNRQELIKLRLDNAYFYLNRAEELSSFPSISSEMLYQAIVEGIKALRDYFGVQREIKDSIPYLSDILGDWIDNSWDLSLKLHYDGYIAELIDRDDMSIYIEKTKEFLKNCEMVILD
ncbi:hypothetical protein CM19_12510 [Candidatus Acidianus copahuensis]|uniref:HEPN domain-containing protein n=1 Tax=Candidatus Acidianus copahuensis TaxID=1160895 RepID=A0A031LHX2_9CREN|nr:hypothetical protein [Candidatus Acidianus copahuensis]EZQ01752.1 hypothetical protein CM19_12510 [Candidatus Acidianus copahuensis]